MIDYSQYGQALILRQLITPDTPKVVVDIGAHDGVCGSNSRELLENGWRGLLVEPMPSVFASLGENSRGIQHVQLVNAACGDRDGTATMRIGRDGPQGQMGSFSTEPSILENLSDDSVEVPVRTLSTLLHENGIPNDFGVLLVDTEGWDLTVLEGLHKTQARPRIIVTEDFIADATKHQLLTALGYKCAGNWGGDSFWISQRQQVDVSGLHLPVLPLSSKWRPSGTASKGGHVKVDESNSFRYTVAGWAWNESFRFPDTEVIVSLRAVGSNCTDSFRAWSFPRPDVAAAFGADHLLMSGFRAHVNVAAGVYEVTITQQGQRHHTVEAAGQVSLPVLNSPVGGRSDSDYRYVTAESSATASSYQEWLVTHEPKLFCRDDQVSQQLANFSHQPLLSILLPTFNTDPQFLERCVHSVLRQCYPNWQLCVVDDCSSDERVVEYIRKVAAGDARIQLHLSSTNAGISTASNIALSMAQGEFIVLLDHDDELHSFALFEVIAALNRNPGLDLIYSDEDKIDRDGHRVCPAFKPDFDFDIFLSFDYLGHMIALRRSIAEEVGGFRTSCNGAQDWDLLLRALEIIDAHNVHHIPKPLYHWRMHRDSTALDLNSKPYVRRAWSRVLSNYLERTALEAEVEPGLFFGSMRLKRQPPKEARLAVFLRTEDGMYQRAALEANVDCRRTAFYELLGSSLTAAVERIWSFEQITEDVMIFINRPLETVNHLFFEELTAPALRKDCGLVTGISVDAGRVLHSGLIRDVEGNLMDPFVDLKFPHDGYLGQLSVVREVETISDEFFAVRREHLANVGGLGSVSASFMPRLVRQLTDHAREGGLRVLATPYAVATFEGVWPSARYGGLTARSQSGIKLNANLFAFENPRDVLGGNI